MALFTLVLFVGSFLVYHDGVIGTGWNLSKEEELKIERQLKILNKPAIKTIRTEYGDLYDCVDFFKQPAFDHPLLKNYTFDFQELPPLIRKTIRNQSSNKFTKLDDIGQNALQCPIRTVPIRRVTKTDLINDYLASKRSVQNGNVVHDAFARTKITANYSGGGAFISIHNPKATGSQYSAARVIVSNGDGGDVIEAGWRVDPTLYHDSKTRFYIRTAAGKTQCFNTFCPGFVLVSSGFPLDSPLGPYSKPGNAATIKVFIVRDKGGNWNLLVGPKNTVLGFWPSSLFKGLASNIVWAGEASAPSGGSFPPMGSGEQFPRNDTKYDSFFAQVSTYNDAGEISDANNLQVGSDSFLYTAYDLEFVNEQYRHVIVYSGEGGTD